MATRPLLILVVVIVTLNYSCLNRQFVDGRAELISIADTALNDSSVFLGYIHQIDWEEPYPSDYFKIWVENTPFETTASPNGSYFLKVVPGKYTLKGQTASGSWDRLIEEVKDIEVAKNKKYRIDFYIGYTIE
ncbi:MAG: hypothetical protein RBT74_11865 [Tenuifilaceae bacterium]|jgi:hypothetical protein|nr:hypothetical protein [Bacteroidales bacterium]MDX9847668.1 hypothetical protein [Tenuifilaceae bacterium]